MTERTPGREPIQIVEIIQPRCANTFGVAPCTATGTPCYNTRGSCTGNYGNDYVLGDPLSLFFCKGRFAEMSIEGVPYIIPSLVSVSTSPTMINLAGSNPDAQGLGNRAVCELVFADHPHSDRRVDPYLLSRSVDPKTRGSFWTKWLARNKYRQNVRINVYEGYAGQALSAMVKRQYFLQSVQGPDESGRIKMQGKDILVKLEERKAQAPVASKGELRSAITAVQTSIDVAGALVSEYAASGTLRIGSEVMTYTGITDNTTYITFTGVTRGTDGTTAATANAEAAVQQCLRFTSQRVDDIIEELLTTYGGVDASFLDLTQWATEVDNYLSFFLLSTLITTPTAVTTLVSQIQEQALVYIWWDERDAQVRMKAVRGVDEEPPLLTDENNILAGSFSLTEKPRERASQVWVYWDRDRVTENFTEPNSYASVVINANVQSETPELYGEPSIRKIFGNWLPNGALAETTASKIINRYVDVPSECKFRMDAKDRTYWVGDTVTISHYLDVDVHGERRLRNWTIISAEEVVPGETIEYVAEDTTLYGRFSYVMAGGSADYPGADAAPFRSAYIGNAAGFLSDGETCARIN